MLPHIIIICSHTHTCKKTYAYHTHMKKWKRFKKKNSKVLLVFSTVNIF